MIGSLATRLARQPWLIAAALLILLVLWFASGALFPRERRSERPVASVPAAPEVQVAELRAEQIMRIVSLSGRTAPSRIVELRAETSGRVAAVGAARGSRVVAGALLVRLDDADRTARLAQARAVLRQRELEFEGQRRLEPQGYISGAKLAEGAALLEAARTELRRAEIDLARLEIRAPFAGALQDREVEVGDSVTPGTIVATFVDERTLVVAASVAEAQAGGMRPGLGGTARLPGGRIVTGVVRYLAPVADAATRTFTIELEIANPRGNIPVGVSAEVELAVGTVAAQRVSSALLTLDDAGTVGIKILDGDSRARFVPANIARSTAAGVWLTGLPDPVRVITVGQGFVKSGDLVRAAAAAPAAATLAARRPQDRDATVRE